MIKEIKINSRNHSYAVNFNTNPQDSEIICVADSYFKDQLVHTKSIFIDAKESNKNLTTCQEIIEFFYSNKLSKEGVVLAVGGGLIQDLVTLASSIYMRGVSWIYKPTTLTSMMDSCIGGKSSINLNTSKNVIGNFWPPKQIIIETEYIKTLSIEDKIAGLAEASKICFAKGEETFKSFTNNPRSLNPSNDEPTSELIFLSLEAKKWFIEIDEFDKNERRLLNFGHTFGHAIESSVNFKINHGISVAIGMLSAILHPSVDEVNRSLELKDYLVSLLRPVKNDLISIMNLLDWDIFTKNILMDKKSSKHQFTLILPSDKSNLSEMHFDKNNKNTADVKQSVINAVELLSG